MPSYGLSAAGSGSSKKSPRAQQARRKAEITMSRPRIALALLALAAAAVSGPALAESSARTGQAAKSRTSPAVAGLAATSGKSYTRGLYASPVYAESLRSK
jgi:hypothetical protein